MHSGSPRITDELFQQLIESISAVTYVLRFGHADEPPIYMSPQCERVLGLPRETVMVDAASRNQLLHPDDRARVWEHAVHIDATGGDWAEEYRLGMPDGTFKWVHDQARIVQTDDGEPALWFGVLTDLTRTNEAEHALASSETKYQALVERIPAVVYIDTVEERPVSLYVSPYSERLSGYRPEEWIEDPELWMRVVHPEDRHLMQHDWPSHLDTPDEVTMEYRIVHRDKHVVWISDSAQLVRAEDGTPLFWQGVSLDITDHMLAQERLRDSEARYRALVEEIPAYVYIATDDPEPRMTYVSPQTLEMIGYDADAWIADGDLWLKAMHPDDRASEKAAWESAVARRTTFVSEYRAIRRDGREIWLRDVARLIPEADGGGFLWQGLVQDITESKRAEEDLRASEVRYRVLVEQVPVVVYVDSNDEHPTSLYVSPQAVEILGHAPQEFLDNVDFWQQTMHPDDWERVQARWKTSVRTGEPFRDEYRFVRPDSDVVWVKDDSRLVRAADGAPMFWQGVLQDITVGKRAEEELRASELRYRSLVEQVPAVVFIDTNDESPVCTYVSPQSLDVLGHAPEAYMEDASLLFRQIHPEDVERVRGAWVDAVRHQEPFLCDYRLVHPDGRLVMVRQAAVLIRGDSDIPLFWQGLIQDLTDRKRAEDELRASEARFRALVERSPAVVYEVGLDDERRTLYVSPQVESLFGYSRQEWLDQPDIWTELLHPDDREIELAANDLHNETGAPWRQEYRLIANDGRVVWVRDQAELVRDESGHGSTWQGIMLDITALKELEEQLRVSNDELELRVIDRTTELADANEMMTLEIGERLRAEAELQATQERYRQLVEEIPAVAYVWRLGGSDEDGAENYTSPQIERLLGFTVEEWNDTDLWQKRLHPHDRDRIFAAAARSGETGAPYAVEYRLLAKDGHVVWVADHSTLLSRDQHGEPRLFQGVLLDITARKEAEALEEQFRELIDSSPVVSWVYESTPDEDPPVRFLHVSQQISQLIGQSVQNLLDDYSLWLRQIHPDDRQQLVEASARSRDSGKPWQRTFRVIGRDGQVVSVLSVGRCVQRDADGTPRRFVGALIDVTASTVERDKLATERAQLRSLVDGLPGFLWTEVVEGEPGSGRLTFIGPRVEEILGYTAEELVSTPGYFDKLVHPDDRDRIDALAVQHDLTEEPWQTEYRSRTRDGRMRWLRSQGLASRDENGRLVWNGITFDITEERATEEDVTVVPETTQVES